MSKTDRPGEIRAPVNPAERPADAGLAFIGRARTPWTDRNDMPHNLRQARERGGWARIEIDAPWRLGLKDLAAGDAIALLTWFDRARRDLVVQAPRHSERVTGVFSLRSPVRPNPIGLHIVRIVSCEAETGLITIDALDCLDGTPVLDVKPWLASVDVPPEIEA
jgi:tRNA-Thr(GGU) m(6)t(6)A37 methyltransferase TsaA